MIASPPLSKRVGAGAYWIDWRSEKIKIKNCVREEKEKKFCPFRLTPWVVVPKSEGDWHHREVVWCQGVNSAFLHR
jgi:hypothetical protein